MGAPSVIAHACAVCAQPRMRKKRKGAQVMVVASRSRTVQGAGEKDASGGQAAGWREEVLVSRRLTDVSSVGDGQIVVVQNGKIRGMIPSQILLQ